MARLLSTLAIFAVAAVASGHRVSRKTRSNATRKDSVALSDPSAGCDQFASMPLIHGINFTRTVLLACQFWPESKGEFPAQSVQDIVDILAAGGGITELLQLIKEEHQDESFCWRSNKAREVVESDCEMEVGDVCYGSCPAGYKPKFLIGNFRPVCETACVASEQPVGCGFGCARDWRSCAKIILHQVQRVFDSTVGFATKDVGELVDQLIGLADFVFNFLDRVVKEAKQVWEKLTDQEITMALIISMFQEVINQAGWVGEKFEELQKKISDIIGFFHDLIDQETRGVLTEKSISELLREQAVDVLRKTLDVVKIFIYTACKDLDTTVVFAVEDAGREEVMGPYIHRGEKNGRPFYTHKDTRLTGVEYDSGLKAWSMFSHVGMASMFKRSLYKVEDAPGVENNDYPVDGWALNYGSEPAPKVVALRQPAA